MTAYTELSELLAERKEIIDGITHLNVEESKLVKDINRLEREKEKGFSIDAIKQNLNNDKTIVEVKQALELIKERREGLKKELSERTRTEDHFIIALVDRAVTEQSENSSKLQEAEAKAIEDFKTAMESIKNYRDLGEELVQSFRKDYISLGLFEIYDSKLFSYSFCNQARSFDFSEHTRIELDKKWGTLNDE